MSTPSQLETMPAQREVGGDVEYDRVKAFVRGSLFGGVSSPAQIGRFTVLRRLGSGGMSVVYSAYDDDLERKVAIKLLRPEPAKHGAAERLRREAQAIARLSHPNVVPVYEVGEHRGQVYLAMEFVRGQTLRTRMDEAPRGRAWSEIRDVMLQAGRGLQAAHAAGIVHRDFKPENVMVGDVDGRVRVLDFGVAALGDDPQQEHSVDAREHEDAQLTRDGGCVGTPAYLSPEAIRGENVGPAADQFTFCATCWEMLTGSRPFEAATLRERLKAIDEGPPSLPASVPHGVRVALTRGLAASAEQRWPDLDALLIALGRASSGRGRWLMGGGALMLAATGAIIFVRQLDEGGPHRCETAAADLAEIWGDARAREAARALANATPAVPLGTWHAARDALDDYARAWASTRTHSCEVDERTGERATLRELCFEWTLHDLRAISTSLTQGDGVAAARASKQVAALTPPKACRDPAEVSQRLQQRARRTAPAPGGSDLALMSDFESEPWAKFGAGWSVSTDRLVGGASTSTLTRIAGGARGSGFALRVDGEVGAATGNMPTWGGAMLFVGERPFTPVNLQAQSSFTFWARGEPGMYAVMLFSEQSGFEPALQTIDVDDRWQQHTVDLDRLMPERYDVTSVFVGGIVPGPFSLDIDDVGFE